MIKRGSFLANVFFMVTGIFGAAAPDIGPAWLVDSYFITRAAAWGHAQTEARGVRHDVREPFSDAWSVSSQLLYVIDCIVAKRDDLVDECILLLDDTFEPKGLAVDGATALACESLNYYLLGLPITQETLTQVFDRLHLDDKTGFYGQSCFEAYDYTINHSTTMDSLYVTGDAAWTRALWQRQLDVMNLLSGAISNLITTTLGFSGTRTEIFKVESIMPHIRENQDASRRSLANKSSDDVVVVGLSAIDEEVASDDGASDAEMAAPDEFAGTTPRALSAAALVAAPRALPPSVRAVVFTDPEVDCLMSTAAAYARRPASRRGAVRAHSPIKW